MMSFESFVRLGWSFARVLGRKLIGGGAQFEQFVSQYQADGILPISAAERGVLDAASRCYACGRCDLHAFAEGTHDALGTAGPMAFVMGVSRHSSHHDAAEISASATPELLAGLTRVCPVDVPFTALVRLVRTRQARLDQVRSEIVVNG